MKLRTVYTASNSMEAHLIKIMLIGQGIDAYVQGDLLQGGLGDLPVVDMMKVSVVESDEDAALSAIRNWEESAPETERGVADPLPGNAD